MLALGRKRGRAHWTFAEFHNVLLGCQTNTNNCTNILLNRHFINIVRNSKMFQPLRGHLQGVQLIHSGSAGQQNEPLVVKFNLVCSVYCIRHTTLCMLGFPIRKYFCPFKHVTLSFITCQPGLTASTSVTPFTCCKRAWDYVFRN